MQEKKRDMERRKGITKYVLDVERRINRVDEGSKEPRMTDRGTG